MKYIIVGAGLAGSILANYISSKNNKVYIYEKRNHIAGNMYDYLDENKILIHKYGPHVFHTNNKKIYNFLLKFSEWNTFNVTAKTLIDGYFIDYPFNLSFIEIFFKNEEKIILDEIKNQFKNKSNISIYDLINNKNKYLEKIGNFLYEKNYIPYAKKQWNMHPNNLNKEILKRNPIFLSYSNKYFSDKYQIIPKKGYTYFFKQLLSSKNIEIYLNSDIKNFIEFRGNKVCLKESNEEIMLFYTGSLDYLFDYKFGKLLYRSTKFEYELSKNFNYDCPIIYFPQNEKFTRVTIYNNFYSDYNTFEYKSIVKEFPIEINNNEPYYPVRDHGSILIYNKYVKFCSKFNNFFYLGRLANYEYYNMDKLINLVLDFIKKNIKEI